MRALSSAAKDWVLAMEDEGDRRPTARRLDLLRKAAESHIEYARSAAEVSCVLVTMWLRLCGGSSSGWCCLLVFVSYFVNEPTCSRQLAHFGP